MTNNTACPCGCGEYVAPRNRFAGHGHHMRLTTPEYAVDGNGCWIWQRSILRGYGTMRVGRTVKRAHRVYYERHVGPIPVGASVCHRCDVKSCVNPAHLFVGTHADNMSDMAQKDRCGRSTLTSDEVRDIRTMLASGHAQRDIADTFGVSVPTISMINTRKIWKHVA